MYIEKLIKNGFKKIIKDVKYFSQNKNANIYGKQVNNEFIAIEVQLPNHCRLHTVDGVDYFTEKLLLEELERVLTKRGYIE